MRNYLGEGKGEVGHASWERGVHNPPKAGGGLDVKLRKPSFFQCHPNPCILAHFTTELEINLYRQHEIFFT